jgi:hypothetical protein
VLLLVLSGCAGVERGRELGTFTAGEWPEMELRAAVERRGLAAKQGEVVVLEGDASLISGTAGAYGIRFDEERNDLGAITARVAEAIDAPAVLVLFTTFDDRGAGGPAYFVPIYNDVNGTGMGPIDQRADFGAAELTAVVNLKQRGGHGDRLAADFVHEVAHRHLAYLPPLTPRSSTVAVEILGRQEAHWHALLSSDGSLLGGHELREIEAGRFQVVSRNVRLSPLDLYLLGLFDAGEVSPFFSVKDGRTDRGAPIPEAAELEAGAEITGTRIDLDADDVVRAAGPRDPGDAEMRVVLALVTRPGESATSTAVAAEAAAIDALRPELELAWSSFTRDRGSLCTRLAGCLVPEAPDGGNMVVKPGSDCGCAALPSARGEGAGHFGPALLLAFMLALRRAFVPLRCRAREPSCGRFPSSASRRRPGSQQPSR